MLWEIRVDANLTGEHHLFRLPDWEISLLVSDTVKDALLEVPDLGVEFKPAS